MKANFKFLFPAAVTLLLVSSCYYDKEDLLYPPVISNTGCDTITAASYATKVVPLLQQYCYSCHQGTGPSGGIEMGTYNSDKAIAISGGLLGTITHANGYSPMPEGTPKLSDCQIAIIKQWIDANSPNN